MSSIYGKNIRVSLFGESHGDGIGVVIDGLPAGIALDMEQIAKHLQRRAPGSAPWATARKEPDVPEILSGVYNGKTTGTPLAAVIRNTNTRSGDYCQFVETPRPGHADYTGSVRYEGYNDPRGGGHFSGRITAPLTFAGAVCLQALAARGIRVHARIVEIAGVEDAFVGDAMYPFSVADKPFPVVDDVQGDEMQKKIAEAHAHGDSVGGIVECVATGMPVGIGSPFFDTVEGCLAQMMFAIPAVKGVEFGKGFAVAESCGSENNDSPIFVDGKLTHRTNNAGGIEGGITNGMPVVMRCAFKPTPSIYSKQETVNLKTKENVELEITGRHDPCIVPRAVPVVESAMAIVLLDLLEQSSKGL